MIYLLKYKKKEDLLFSSLACVASEKVTRLSRFFIVTPKEVLHFPFITSEETSDKVHNHFIFTPKEALETGLFSYIFMHFFTLQHTDFVPFLMLQDRRFYPFFRVPKPVKICTKMTLFYLLFSPSRRPKFNNFYPFETF